MGYSAFYGEFEVDATNQATIIDANAVNLDILSYYIYSGTDADSLMYELYSAWLPYKTCTFTISALGILTISAGSAFAFTVSAEIADVLGFATTSYSGSASYTATKYLRYCWFPQRSPSGSLSPVTRPGNWISYSNQSQGADSSVYTSYVASLREQKLDFDFVTNARTFEDASDYQSFEEFYNDVYSVGKPFLFYPDKDVAVYWEYVAKLSEEQRLPVKRKLVGSDTYWSITMDLRSLV